MQPTQTAAYKIAVSRRPQLLSKIINALRAHIEKFRIQSAEIAVAGISQKEFIFNVTPSLTNYRVVKGQKLVEASLDKIEMSRLESFEAIDFAGILENFDKVEVVAQASSVSAKTEVVMLKLSAEQDNLLKNSRTVWSVLSIEFPFVRVSRHHPVLQNSTLSVDCSSEDEKIMHSFLERVRWRPAKELYELLGLYGYLLEATSDSRKVLIFNDQFLRKYDDARQLVCVKKLHSPEPKNKSVWMQTEYIKIVNSKPEVLHWSGRNELEVTSKAVNGPRTEVDRRYSHARRFREVTLRLKKTKATERMTNLYLFALKRRLFELQHANRISECIEIALEFDQLTYCHLLTFVYEPNRYYDEFVRAQRDSFKLTNFRIGVQEFPGLRNALLRRYLQEHFFCLFREEGESFACSVMVQQEKPLREFLGMSKVIVEKHYPLDAAEVEFFRRYLLQAITQRKAELRFSYELVSDGVKVSCSSEAAYLKACELFGALRKAVTTLELKVKSEQAQQAMQLLKSKQPDYPDVEVQLFGFSCDPPAMKDIKNIKFEELVIIVHEQVGSKKADFIQVDTFFKPESTKMTNFQIFQGITPHERMLQELVEVIRRALVAEQKHLNLVLTQDHFADFLTALRDLAKLRQHQRPGSLQINVYTARPRVLHHYLQQNLRLKELTAEFSTILLKGLSWNCEKLANYFKREFVQKRCVLECTNSNAENLLVRINRLAQGRGRCVRKLEGVEILSTSKPQTSQLLSACIIMASRG